MSTKETGIRKIQNPDRISSYFKHEIPVLLIISVTGIIYNIGMTAGPYFEGQLVQKLSDILKGYATPTDMLRLCIFYIFVILIVQGARSVKRFYVRRFANNVNKNMRCMVYNSMLFHDRTEYTDASKGVMMTKAISDVDACSEGMRKVTTEIFDTGVVLVAYWVMLLSYDWRLALICSIFPPIAYVIAEKLKAVVYRYNKEYKKQTELLSNTTEDRISGEMLYRIFGREEAKNEEYNHVLKAYEKASVKATVWESSMAPVYLVISSISVIFILYFGSKNVCGTGWVSWNIASFTTFLACFTKLAAKSSKAAKLFNAVQKADVSWKRIQPFMEEYKENEPDSATYVYTLEINNLSFHYPNGDNVLCNVSLSSHTGEIIGVTGPVASGKSTFGKVLLNEYPYTGSITINGKELSSLSEEELNSAIVYLGHDPELISASIKDNISLGDDIDIHKWLSLVCLDKEVGAMPEKENSRIGNGGTRLSGGQQARVALARTLSHAKGIIVLDDPFSALDASTEKEILSHIEEMRKDHIIFLISHRLSLFSKFENVLWIDHNTVQCADHETLLRENAEYRKLYTLQNGGIDYDQVSVH